MLHCKKTSQVEDDRRQTSFMCPKCGETLHVPPMEDLVAPTMNASDQRAIVAFGWLLSLGWLGMTAANVVFQFALHSDSPPFFPFLEPSLNRLVSIFYIALTGSIGVAMGWLFLTFRIRHLLWLQGWFIITCVFALLYLVLGLVLYPPWGLFIAAGWILVLLPNAICMRLYEKNRHVFP